MASDSDGMNCFCVFLHDCAFASLLYACMRVYIMQHKHKTSSWRQNQKHELLLCVLAGLCVRKSAFYVCACVLGPDVKLILIAISILASNDHKTNIIEFTFFFERLDTYL